MVTVVGQTERRSAALPTAPAEDTRCPRAAMFVSPDPQAAITSADAITIAATNTRRRRPLGTDDMPDFLPLIRKR